MTVKRRSNSQDVADLASVSQASVSRAFTPGASVSAKTKAKILNAAAKLDYQPNIIARSLSKNQSGLVGILFANWDHPKAAEILKGLCEAITEKGFKPVVQSANTLESVDHAFTDFLSYQVDGVIVFSTSPSANMSALCIRSNIPIVLLNHTAPGINASIITIDSAKVGRDIGNALLERSYKRIAIVSSDPNSQVVSGISNSLAETVNQTKGTRIISERTGIHGYEAGLQTIVDLWREDVKPDVIVCTSDYTALGILSGCRHKLNINVPQDLSIIGLGDIPVAGWTDHDLSTVKIPHNELVRTSVTTLISKIETQSVEPESIKLDAELILRGTIRSL